MPRALVVEDEAIAAMALQVMLENLGWEVVGVVTRGEEALELALAHAPDAVLMDIRLKGAMSGVESAKAIRAHLPTPIIFTTAYSIEEITAAHEIDEGFLFVTKPIRTHELARALATCRTQGRDGPP